ncbi:MAG TPA: nucleotidyltransferase domain-containing protein [Fimbriimonadaceae bacterium]|jgi:hypothetical protein
MDSAKVASALEPLKAQFSTLGVRQLLLVGSVARGEYQSGSDVDFVVEFEGPATFFAYMELVELLEKALELPVDLATINTLRPEIADTVLSEARRVA